MGGLGHGQHGHTSKEIGDGDSLDAGAIVVLNELIIGERKKRLLYLCVCVTSVHLNLSGLNTNALNSENIRKEHCHAREM